MLWRTRAALCAALLALVVSAFLCSAFDLVEVLYVRGCEDSSEARETRSCFRRSARSKATSTAAKPDEVKLTIRGVNFPKYTESAENAFYVELVESVAPKALDIGETLGEAAESAEAPRVRLPCVDAMPSTVFPTQLLTCTLKNPLAGLPKNPAESTEEGKSVLAQWEAVNGVKWFDVVVSASFLVMPNDPSQGETYQFENIGILRRAVEVDLSQVLLKNSGRTKKPVEFNISSHPLERLYTHKSKRRSAEDDEPVDAEDEEDYLWMELGIGGLKKELRMLFRRVFLSRLPSLANLTEALEIQHVRGVILYGPPGNGKSLIARSLFKLLGPDTRLTVVNAADVLSKFVGESEKNLRDAFGGYPIGMSSRAEADRKDGKAPAESEADDSEDADDEGDRDDDSGDEGKPHRKGEGSRPKRLHVLVIDEFEALFRRRGSSEDESSAKAVYDGITNTLLSLMDGIESRNDLLVVGLTNRLQSIDPALLRPGRFEVLIEVPAPDVPAREEIFFIHTARLRETDFLSSNVSLHDLAVRSGGFSGSDIAGTVRSATSHALLRYRQGDAAPSSGLAGEDATAVRRSECEATSPPDADGRWAACEALGEEEAASTQAGSGGLDDNARFEVTNADLDRAMADIRSAKDETSALTYLGDEHRGEKALVVYHSKSLVDAATRMTRLVRSVQRSGRVFSGTVGIAGGAGNGKSFFAQQLTAITDFATVRFLGCRRLVEMSSRFEQLEQVREAFAEASRVASGIVVLDDFDLLLDSMSGHPVLEGTLKNLLYEFRNRRRGVSRSLSGAGDSARDATEAGGGGVTVNAGSALHDEHNHRFLIVTSTRQDALRAAEPDVNVRVRPLRHADRIALLDLYNISAKSSTATSDVALAYPPSISYRNFLRVTDMALTTVAESFHDDDDSAAAENSAPFPSFFARAVESAAPAGEDARQRAGPYFLQAKEQVKTFRKAVTDVCNSMGMSVPFAAFQTQRSSDSRGASSASNSNDDESENEAVSLTEVGEAIVDEGLELLW